MYKSIQRNSILYKNTNNVWIIFEFLWNNAFSDLELLELWDFLQQNQLLMEFIIQNINGVKKYFVSFYKWEIGWANNYNTYNSKKFYQTYNEISNLLPRIKELKIFKGKIQEVDLKLYKLDKEWNSEYRKDLLKKLKFNPVEVKNMILQKNFSSYVQNMLKNTDYQKYIYNQDYYNSMNFEFNAVDQENFETALKFMIWNRYFIFPFYFKWITNKSWDYEFQELSFQELTNFFDKYVTTEKETTGRDILSYEYKISIRPTNNVSANPATNKVLIDGQGSKFDLTSVNDSRNMFFEFQHSIFLYTKRPDIQKIIKNFWDNFWTKIELVQTDIPKDFNPQYMSHNKFVDAYHIWHIKNIKWIIENLKEYLPARDDGMWIWKEYFSNNDFQVNFFDLSWKEPWTWNLIINANGLVVWGSGSWKTYIVENRIFKRNNKDQVIVFDNMDNFSSMFNKMTKEEKDFHNIWLFEYWNTFPNIIWKIKSHNVTWKQSILQELLMWLDEQLDSSNREMIKANINTYLQNSIWGFFKLDLFRSFIENKKVDELFSFSQKSLLLNKIDALSSTLKNILNNEVDFETEIFKYQKVVISYWNLKKEAVEQEFYFILWILLNLINWYLKVKRLLWVDNPKNKYPYTMILYDEAHNVINKTKKLDNIFINFIREIRNYRSNIVVISQWYHDFQQIVLRNLNFFIILDTDNWEAFLKDKQWTNISEEWLESKMQLLFQNFNKPLEIIKMNYQRDKALVEEWKISTKDQSRFCTFFRNDTWQLFVINTKA